MEFDFQEFIDLLSFNEEKQQFINRYISVVEPLNGISSFKELKPYREYVCLFPTFPYLVRNEMADDFDWDLLQQLLFASMSSATDIAWNTYYGQTELYVCIISEEKENRNSSLIKSINELTERQISRLFEIYFEEMMNIQILKEEDELEARLIVKERLQKVLDAKALKLKNSKFAIMASFNYNDAL